MQILAFGLHKHNIPENIWQRGKQDISSFIRFIKPFHKRETNSEFLYIDTEAVREIFAVVEKTKPVKLKLSEFFREALQISDSDDLIIHELEGPEAVRHFLLLSLGIESIFQSSQDIFLQRAHTNIEVANKYNIAGPVINRMYHDALMLKGELKKNGVVIDYSLISEQIKKLIQKIFGKVHSLNFLVIGKNDSTTIVLDNLLQNQQSTVRYFSSATLKVDSNSLNFYPIYSDDQLKSFILQSHVIFRMNQEARYHFQPESLKEFMNKRKNQPLLIINLDSTITCESTLNRIYNLYVYEIADFQNGISKSIPHADLNKLIEGKLKKFFSWFFSKDMYRFGDIVAKSNAMENILELIARISQTDITVLIQGESGTGKEIIAKAIHENSLRCDRPFIVVNCGALPETLLESELFGHEKGAFTGAIYTKKGLFEEAHEGTIFLDEIGDTSPALQVKLLRVLQEGEIKRIGSNETIHIDVRLIAATNQNLSELVKQKKFRQDLYYRLNVVNIDIPPLRERKEDILPLAEFFMGKYSDKMKKQVKSFSDDVKQALLMYSWPGNVRELENAIERAVALAIGNEIHLNDLPATIRQDSVFGIIENNVKNKLSLKEIEKKVIQSALIAHNWNYDKVANILDIGRTTLWRKMKEFGISKK